MAVVMRHVFYCFVVVWSKVGSILIIFMMRTIIFKF